MCPRIVFQGALAVGADAVVLIHNHPAGSRTPSKADIDVAKYFKEFERIVAIPVLEHLILTEEGLHPYFKNGSVT
jgi:DNA repair protein RadC